MLQNSRIEINSLPLLLLDHQSWVKVCSKPMKHTPILPQVLKSCLSPHSEQTSLIVMSSTPSNSSSGPNITCISYTSNPSWPRRLDASLRSSGDCGYAQARSSPLNHRGKALRTTGSVLPVPNNPWLFLQQDPQLWVDRGCFLPESWKWQCPTQTQTVPFDCTE